MFDGDGQRIRLSRGETPDTSSIALDQHLLGCASGTPGFGSMASTPGPDQWVESKEKDCRAGERGRGCSAEPPRVANLSGGSQCLSQIR
jgi:hypothetical protein